MRFLKNTWTKLIEGILFLSSTITTFAIILIVVFLFKEGAGIFGEESVEGSFTVVVNKRNDAKELSAQQIKHIFDQEITNWSSVSSLKDSIILFRIDEIANYCSEEELGAEFEHLPAVLGHIVDSIPGIIAFVPDKYITKDFKGRVLHVEEVNLKNFFAGSEWYPTAQPAAQFGVLSLILGTLWVSFGAILIALPIGLMVSVYMAEVANEKFRKFLKPVIELLAGIPSVVYGFFGLVIIVPFIQNIFGLPVGETALAGSIVLGIMALPTIITISEDAIRTTPRAMKEASLALGATHWQTIYKVIIPYSISGITAAAILGIGRAIGETMAVLMVTGNAAVIPSTFLEPVRTIPATIAAELGEAPQGDMHYKALFALGCILFIITLAINLIVEYMASKQKMHKH